MARIRRLTGGRAWIARLSGLLVLAAIIALIVAVLPAFGAHVPKVEVPLGGQGNDCAALALVEDPSGTFPYSHLATIPDLKDFRVENPQNDTFTDPVTGASFTLTGLAGGGKSFSWSTAHLVHAIVVKGGQKSVVYDYTTIGGGTGPISSHDALAAPDKSNGKTTFNVSHVSFCYEVVVADISGKVFHDHDQDGIQDNPPHLAPTSQIDPVEPGLDGWTVTVYDSNGNVVATTSTIDAPGTEAHGTYLFQDLNAGQTYTVCQADPNGGQWGQADVGGTWSTSACGSGSEEDGGHVILLEADATADFGNFNTKDVTCGITVSDPSGEHSITLPSAESGLCLKPPGEYVYEIYLWADDGPTEVNDFHPVGTDFAPDEVIHVTEVHVWSLPNKNQNSTELEYNDSNPYDLNEDQVALYCNFDPTDASGDLIPALVTDEENPVLPTDHTTCIITSTEGADGERTDFLYSRIDGRRWM